MLFACSLCEEPLMGEWSLERNYTNEWEDILRYLLLLNDWFSALVFDFICTNKSDIPLCYICVVKLASFRHSSSYKLEHRKQVHFAGLFPLLIPPAGVWSVLFSVSVRLLVDSKIHERPLIFVRTRCSVSFCCSCSSDCFTSICSWFREGVCLW